MNRLLLGASPACFLRKNRSAQQRPLQPLFPHGSSSNNQPSNFPVFSNRDSIGIKVFAGGDGGVGGGEGAFFRKLPPLPPHLQSISRLKPQQTQPFEDKIRTDEIEAIHEQRATSGAKPPVATNATGPSSVLVRRAYQAPRSWTQSRQETVVQGSSPALRILQWGTSACRRQQQYSGRLRRARSRQLRART